MKSHHTAHGIAAKTDTFSARRGTRGRNIKNSGDGHISSRHPELFRLTKDGMPKGMQIDREIHPRMQKLVLDKDTFAHHNPYVETNVVRAKGSGDGRREAGGDVSVSRNAAQTHLMSLLHGRVNRGLKDAISYPIPFRQFIRNADKMMPEKGRRSRRHGQPANLLETRRHDGGRLRGRTPAAEEALNDPNTPRSNWKRYARESWMRGERSAAERKTLTDSGGFGADRNMESMLMETTWPSFARRRGSER